VVVILEKPAAFVVKMAKISTGGGYRGRLAVEDVFLSTYGSRRCIAAFRFVGRPSQASYSVALISYFE
jgi:hypothetical protein